MYYPSRINEEINQIKLKKLINLIMNDEFLINVKINNYYNNNYIE